MLTKVVQVVVEGILAVLGLLVRNFDTVVEDEEDTHISCPI